MSADTYLYVLNEEVPNDDTHGADRVWIGQGSGQSVDLYTPAPVAFITRLFAAGPVLTEGLVKDALSCMNMRNDSQYGAVEVFHEGLVLDVNWHGPRGRSKFAPSRHNVFHRTRTVHGKQGAPRIMTFRSHGVGAQRPVKQFLQANIGNRIVALVD
jgi:hypothetical protein